MAAKAYYSGRGPLRRDVVFRLWEDTDSFAIGVCVGMWTGEKRHALEGEWYIVQGRCRRANCDIIDKEVPIARIYPVVRTNLVEIAGMPIDRVADRHLEKLRQLHR